MNEYFWEIEEYDGTVTKIPPTAIDVVKRRMESKQPINTTHRSIPFAQIKSFHVTEKPYLTQPLIEAAASAFHEPILNDEGEIEARWVKKLVPSNKWDKYYSAGAYKKLSEMNGMVWVAFVLPSHQIDPSMTPYCNTDEIRKLEHA